ncbi:hypothetical protein A3E39_00520 [Candidatus Uhrbacteria bacterium RIFCSPHIGHO2_12_FULL_60_25]|uniref:3D domain-containing protein n=1 Tax=Candidatus Uhrbacteria bacterium RIFCSPHIGHO2_12_FULL_60_25 TaxID=1802399 RepID=A0A1F7UMF9_9BACT|nr:MAG: hypothetical protein A3D73_01965 [Candidatus Uhrbacteria bacterium RIFCSPHIGHO2_02_FULL_60_44]OGL79466.1 MAG: hypothetical protein A3E39_00520 [Candidatus Uhrbacteria bacterium RIFCSPHIGHO2_12_FULL_60_25]
MNYHNFSLTNDEWKRAILTGLLVSFVIVSMPTRTVTAQEILPDSPEVQTDQTAGVSQFSFTLPEAGTNERVAREISTGYKVVRAYARVPSTAYTSRPEETDSTPFITADGTHVRDGIVAANFLKFGTKIRIPELFGDKIFEVHDRMNKRYNVKVDVWMDNLAKARQHGIRRVTIEIVEPVEKS